MIRDRKYLDWLRSQPCIVTGLFGTENDAIDPSHIGTAGKGLKSSDDEALPICHSIHNECHAKGEMSVLRKMLPNAILREALRALARENYQKYLQENQKGLMQ